MGAMDLHGVETRIFRPYRRPGEGLDDEGDSCRTHLLAGLTENDARNGRRGFRFSPCRRFKSLSARMVELEGDLPPFTMDGLGKPRQPGYEGVAPGPIPLRKAFPRGSTAQTSVMISPVPPLARRARY